MIVTNGFLSPNRRPEDVIVRDLKTLKMRCDALRALGMVIVYTQGSFDLKHVGHDRYLAKARSFGDVLVVGVDDDEKIRKKKGVNRPVVSEDERLEQLCYLSSVGMVVLKLDSFEHLAVQKAIHPDVLVVSRSTKEFTEEELDEYHLVSNRLEVLNPQAETSTTARVRRLMLDFKQRVTAGITDAIPGLVEQLSREFEGDRR
jgi:D-beta-D-heptose 7-phosphate kinase/D-beta-D-heptose 1-phosphate adenosyltransferase